jgi:hypothetical protein
LLGRPVTMRAGLVSEREMERPSTKDSQDREVGMTEAFLLFVGPSLWLLQILLVVKRIDA